MRAQWVLWVLGASLGFGTGARALPPPTGRVLARSTAPARSVEYPWVLPLDGRWKALTGSLSPADLYAAAVDDSAWPELRVPGNWFLEGWNVSGQVWYRRRFEAPLLAAGTVASLEFAGVDYAADVWLNGIYLGHHEGCFAPFAFSAVGALKPGGSNLLAVRVDSPVETPEAWSLHKRLIKGVFAHHDTRPGGAWSPRGQEANTGGIWASVTLRLTSRLRLGTLRVHPDVDPTTGMAAPRVELAVDRAGIAGIAGRAGSVNTEVDFAVALAPDNFAGPAMEPLRFRRPLKAGLNEIILKLPPRAVELWWPWEHGEPRLYRVAVTASLLGSTVDRVEAVVGFRTVTEDTSGAWRINGRRTFLRGTNYIATQWLSEMTPERFAFDVALMKAANVNIVRVHAHVEPPAFYRACDAAGILVWQDFPLQWGYTDEPAFAAEAERQAVAMVDLLFNHPAVVAWSLHNEPPWDADWMRYRYSDYDPEQNRSLDLRLHAAVASRDPSRVTHLVSSTKEHPWYGWYSGSWLDYAKPAKVPLITEFGAQALPGLSSLRRFLAEDELWPTNEAAWTNWEYHNFQRKETFENAGVAKGASIDELIANTQGYQARLIKLAAESYRRQRYAPVAGIFQFMFVESWPSINWGILDTWRQPKAGYWALRDAYQPVMPSVEWQRQSFKAGEEVALGLWVVNDLQTAFPGATLRWVLRRGGAAVDSGDAPLDIAPDSGGRVATLRRKDLPVGHYELAVRLEGRDGKPLGRSEHTFDVTSGSSDAH
jgi:beta-mannosidase